MYNFSNGIAIDDNRTEYANQTSKLDCNCSSESVDEKQIKQLKYIIIELICAIIFLSALILTFICILVKKLYFKSDMKPNIETTSADQNIYSRKIGYETIEYDDVKCPQESKLYYDDVRLDQDDPIYEAIR